MVTGLGPLIPDEALDSYYGQRVTVFASDVLYERKGREYEPVFVAQSIEPLLRANESKEAVEILRDVAGHCIKAPYDRLIIETAISVHTVATNAMAGAGHVGHGYVVISHLVKRFANGRVALVRRAGSAGLMAVTDENGVLCNIHAITDGGGDALVSPVDAALFARAVRTLALLNCRNVATREESRTPAEYRATWAASKREATARYKILSISDTLEHRPIQETTQGEHRDLPLHMVRGHFVRYTQDRPLFGKYTGQFWRSAHLRGDGDNGAVVKDYNYRPRA